MSINSFFQHRICFSIQPQLQLVNLHRNRRYFVIKLHTWFCLSYFLTTNIKCYCIYQYLMSINSFFNTVSVSRYSRPITVTCDPDQQITAVFFLILLFNQEVIRRRKSVNNIKYNGKKKKYKQRSTNTKTKDQTTRIPLKTGGESRCSGRVSSYCSTCDICIGTLCYK